MLVAFRGLLNGGLAEQDYGYLMKCLAAVHPPKAVHRWDAFVGRRGELFSLGQHNIKFEASIILQNIKNESTYWLRRRQVQDRFQ